jgi:hypothetical protein
VNIADYRPFQFTAHFGAWSNRSSGSGIGRPISAALLVIHQSKRLFSQGQAGPAPFGRTVP